MIRQTLNRTSGHLAVKNATTDECLSGKFNGYIMDIAPFFDKNNPVLIYTTDNTEFVIGVREAFSKHFTGPMNLRPVKSRHPENIALFALAAMPTSKTKIIH